MARLCYPTPMTQDKTNSNSSPYVLIGKVHSAQGIKGEIFVSIFSEEAEWADQWQTLSLSSHQQTTPRQEFKILHKREHQKQKKWGFALRLQGVNDRNASEALVGSQVYIPESFVTTEGVDDIYLREVLGFRVIDQKRGDVGEVIGFAGNWMQDLLVVRGEAGEFEVPFVEPILCETDKDNKRLIMDIPMGLVAGEEL